MEIVVSVCNLSPFSTGSKPRMNMDVSFFKNDLENDVPMDSEIGKKGHLKLICCGNISM